MSNCELCWREATHVDDGKPDPDLSTQFTAVYRSQPLCPVHARERREHNTSRVRCLHIRLDPDGACYQCGADCR